MTAIPRQIEERIATLEAGHESTDERLGKIENTLERISDQISTIRVPNVSMWISAAGLAVTISGGLVGVGLTIGGVVMAGFSKEMHRMEEYFRERTNANLIQINNLDVTLQREMRILDDATKQQVTELDKRLQHEQDLKMEILRSERRADIAEANIESRDRSSR